LFDPGADPETGAADHRLTSVTGMAIRLTASVLEESPRILRIASHSLLLGKSSESFAFGMPGLRRGAAFCFKPALVPFCGPFWQAEGRTMTTATEPVGMEALKWQRSKPPAQVFVALDAPVRVEQTKFPMGRRS
jgi:hypothetical protein